jgi:aryl-alcohol dehydrogenase-like predicted oxidoreductase
LDISPNQVVLALLLQHQNPAVIPVTGVSTIEQIRNNIESMNVHLADEQIQILTI